MLAACGAGPRSYEALEAVAAARARGGEFAYRERRSAVLRAL
jgi:hypothetical protein